MPLIWPDIHGINAAFLTRKELDESGKSLESVTLPPDGQTEMRSLHNNRNILADYFNSSRLQLALGRQVHGNHVKYVAEPGVYGDCDGLVTDKAGLAIGVLVADCGGVLLFDREHRVVGAVHAGWRGAADRILPKAVDIMIRFGAEPNLMHAFISPCISQSVFEVGNEVASLFPARFVNYRGDKPHIDLGSFLKDELIRSGITDERIINDGRCTVEHSNFYHSYRRDGKKSGRMMASILLT